MMAMYYVSIAEGFAKINSNIEIKETGFFEAKVHAFVWKSSFRQSKVIQHKGFLIQFGIIYTKP